MKNKVRAYSILRILLVLLVVIAHCQYLRSTTPLGGVNYAISKKIIAVQPIVIIIGWIQTFIMPLFFMLSGAVYHLSEKNSIDELASKKFKRLIIPYFLYGLLFMLPIKRIASFYTHSDFSEVIKNFLGDVGESGHLWFLPALFWISIVFFIILKIFKNKSIFAILITSFLVQIYHAKYIPINIFGFQAGMNYIFWYALGYCFDIFRQRSNFFNSKKNIIVLFLISLIVVLINNKYKMLDKYFTVIFNASMFYSLVSIILFTKIGNTKMWDFMEKYSMNIYLYHDPLNYVILMLALKYNICSSLIGKILYVLARTIGVVIISIILAKIVNKIKTFAMERNMPTRETANS